MDERDFNNIETRAVIEFFYLQGKAPKEIHAILTETLACSFPGRAKNLSVPVYNNKAVKCVKHKLPSRQSFSLNGNKQLSN